MLGACPILRVGQYQKQYVIAGMLSSSKLFVIALNIAIMSIWKITMDKDKSHELTYFVNNPTKQKRQQHKQEQGKIQDKDKNKAG